MYNERQQVGQDYEEDTNRAAPEIIDDVLESEVVRRRGAHAFLSCAFASLGLKVNDW